MKTSSQDSPDTVQIGEVEGGPDLAKYFVADPAGKCQRPPKARKQPQLEHSQIITPKSMEGEEKWLHRLVM